MKTAETEQLKGRFRIINLGRNKVNKEVLLQTESDFWKAVCPHLMSQDVSYDYSPAEGKGKIYAGVRPVGEFEKIKEEWQR